MIVSISVVFGATCPLRTGILMLLVFFCRNYLLCYIDLCVVIDDCNPIYPLKGNKLSQHFFRYSTIFLWRFWKLYTKQFIGVFINSTDMHSCLILLKKIYRKIIHLVVTHDSVNRPHQLDSKQVNILYHSLFSFFPILI